MTSDVTRTGPPAHALAMGASLVAFALACAWLWATYPAGAVDLAVAELATGVRTPDADRVAVLVTMFGDADFLVWPMAATVAVLAILGRHRLAVDAGALFLAAPIAAMSLKALVGRPRPPSAYVLSDSFAFPSGHVTGGAVMLGALAVLYLADRRDASFATRALVWGPAAVGALGIAASRVWLAAHWLSDTLAALALAGAGVAWFAGRAAASAPSAARSGPQPLLGPWLVTGYLLLWALHVHARFGAATGLYSGAAG